MQTNDRSVCCRMCFPSGVHSLASPNGFYPVYALMYSLYSVCGSQRFLFCLSPYLFSEWHIVPQLCVQIKQSRVYSRKALAECKASRRLGKRIRGLYRFLSKLPPSYKNSKADAQDSPSCTSAFAYTHFMKLLLHSVYLIVLLSSFYYRRILPVIVHIKPC